MAPFLEIKDLVKTYPATSAAESITSLKGISLAVNRGESLGIIGQSGAGKTTLARCILGLESPERGEILFQGERTPEPGSGDWAPLREKIQIIWQDPYAYLNPYMRVTELIREPLDNYRRGNHRDRMDKVSELLGMVGLDTGLGERYPHELSGGQCQRVVIARALVLGPELLICDEPLSSLDTLLQIQIIDLFQMLGGRLGLTYLFISHDLAAVRNLCSHVAVFHQGEIVERGTVRDIFEGAVHPYTRLLLASMLPLDCPCHTPEGNSTNFA